MIQINCTVIGARTDVPFLIVDTDPVGTRHFAEIESESRVIFRLPDSTPPHGATIYFGAREVRYVIPSAPGAYEGPVLEYRSDSELRPLHVEGLDVRDDRGQRFVYKGASAFMLPRRIFDGEDVVPIVRQYKEHGANTLRLFLSKHENWRFYPSDYPDFQPRLADLVDFIAAEGLRSECVVFTDAQETMRNQDAHAFFQEVDEVLMTRAGAMLSLVNEYQKNGIEPRAFPRPRTQLCSRGSSVSDTIPPMPAWDASYLEWHGRRDFPKVWVSTEDMFYVGRGIDGEGNTTGNYAGPIWHTEPIGFAPFDEEGRRSTDPRLAYALGAAAGALGGGGCLHSESGLFALAWSDQEIRCARAFYLGLSASEGDR